MGSLGHRAAPEAPDGVSWRAPWGGQLSRVVDAWAPDPDTDWTTLA
jgi:hypothetical protein